MNDLTNHALGYLDAGLHILALHGKRPNPRYHENWSWDESIHGKPETDEDREALEEVFTHPSTTGIAVLIPENMLVADVDTEEAATLFMALVDDVMPDTVAARTTKGMHIWYLAPGADGSRWLGGRTLLFKGFGGYVAVEPSAHFTDDSCAEQDGTYTWISEPGTGMQWLPDKIATLLKENDLQAAARPVIKSERQMGVALDPIRLWPTWNIAGLKKAIENAADGNQNNMIAWAAMTASEDGVPYEVAMKHLLEAAVRGGHPRRRAMTTIKGVYARASRG